MDRRMRIMADMDNKEQTMTDLIYALEMLTPSGWSRDASLFSRDVPNEYPTRADADDCAAACRHLWPDAEIRVVEA